MARPQAPCGTLAAYKRHLRSGEKPDGACVQANRDVKRGQRDVKRRREVSAVVDLILAAPAAADVTQAPETPTAKADLELSREALVDAIRTVKATDPSRLAPLVRELRETWKAMAALAEDGKAGEDEFARAREARAARKAGA